MDTVNKILVFINLILLLVFQVYNVMTSIKAHKEIKKLIKEEK